MLKRLTSVNSPPIRLNPGTESQTNEGKRIRLAQNDMKINLAVTSSFWWVGAVLLGLSLGWFPANAQGPLPLRVLFLGDDGHHRPADRFKQLEPVLAGQHIELDYTDSLADLSQAKLAGYDCLLIYANWMSMSTSAETNRDAGPASNRWISTPSGVGIVRTSSYSMR